VKDLLILISGRDFSSRRGLDNGLETPGFEVFVIGGADLEGLTT
jgi:hypothetical protein